MSERTTDQIHQNECIDEESRQLARGAMGFDICLCVEAGAGTGKTSVMVDRIIRLIGQGLSPLDGIVAITFTEKAASELKERLRRSLQQKVIDESEKITKAELRRYRTALSSMGRARISTIHSFARDIITSYPSESGIDPSASLIDPLELQPFIQEVWDKWLSLKLERRDCRLARFLAAEGSIRNVQKLAEFMMSRPDVHFQNVCPKTLDLKTCIHSLREISQQMNEITARSKNMHNEGCVTAKTISNLLASIDSKSGTEQDVAVLEARPKTSLKFSQSDWSDKNDCKILKEYIKQVREILDEVKASTLGDLVNLCSEFVDEYTKAKVNRSLLDFDDLLIKCRDMLKENIQARKAVQSSINYLLVDEYQDTDELQTEIVFLLAENGARASCWRDVELAPGKLFVVGDPKQSIYRFRRADIELYSEAKHKIDSMSDVTKPVLKQNFRTLKSVVDWVDDTFGKMIMKPEDGDYQPNYTSLVAYRNSSKTTACGVWTLWPSIVPVDKRPQGKINPNVIRTLEAESICKAIIDMVDESAITLDDRGTIRPVAYRDIAILVPNTTDMEVYLEALRSHNIPYSFSGDDTYYGRPEVIWTISALRSLLDPSDSTAIVSVLRSPLFGISDDMLLTHVADGGEFRYIPGLYSDSVQPTTAIETAFALLANLYSMKFNYSLSRLLMALFEQTHIVECLMASDDGNQANQAIANLHKIVELAKKHEADGKGTLSTFVKWLDHNRNSMFRRTGQSEEVNSSVYRASDDVVTLMTIHKSKGLEWPIVILANLSSGEKNANPDSFIIDKSSGALEFCISKEKALLTPGYKLACEMERKRHEAERIRLLYVACTRPRDMLLVSAFDKVEIAKIADVDSEVVDNVADDETSPSQENSSKVHMEKERANFLSYIRNALETTKPFTPSWTTPSSVDSTKQPVVSVGQLVHLRSEFLKDLDDTMTKAASGWRIVRPSAHPDLACSVEPDDSHDHRAEEITEDEDSMTSGIDALLRGILFHRVMERIDLGKIRQVNSDHVDDVVSAVCGEANHREAVPEICSLIRSCLNLPIIKEAMVSPKVLREVPFMCPIDDNETEIYNGVIDMLFEDGNGNIVVVDYKTDMINKTRVDARLERYVSQGAIYGKVVEKLMPGRLREVAFAFPYAGETRTYAGGRFVISSAKVTRS